MSDEADIYVIPEEKIREAHAKCMQDPALAKYFDEAPQGARQYIALMFYCTVFQDEVDDEKCAQYQEEVEAELTKEDLLYLATHERNRESKAHFRELYVDMVNAEKRTDEEYASPAASLDIGRLERQLDGLKAELQQMRKLLAEGVTRENTAPGALSMGLLSLLLTMTWTAAWSEARSAGLIVVIAMGVAASICGLCSSVRSTREFKPARIAGALLSGISLLTWAGWLFFKNVVA